MKERKPPYGDSHILMVAKGPGHFLVYRYHNKSAGVASKLYSSLACMLTGTSCLHGLATEWCGCLAPERCVCMWHCRVIRPRAGAHSLVHDLQYMAAITVPQKALSKLAGRDIFHCAHKCCCSGKSRDRNPAIAKGRRWILGPPRNGISACKIRRMLQKPYGQGSSAAC
ncbi:hypothetical protein BDW68DRAFT_150416 [Aspergillus falconensis]